VTTGISNFTGTRNINGVGGGLRPDLLAPVTVTGNPAQWFSNPLVCTEAAQTGITQPLCSATPNAAFGLPLGTTPAGDHFGDIGRNVFTGPKFVNADLSLVKNTKLTERMNLQFRTEAFDVLNHPNFGNPNLNAQSSTFGRITSTRFPTGDFGSARQLQLSLKLQF
jgi:hypothetical protein